VHAERVRSPTLARHDRFEIETIRPNLERARLRIEPRDQTCNLSSEQHGTTQDHVHDRRRIAPDRGAGAAAEQYAAVVGGAISCLLLAVQHSTLSHERCVALAAVESPQPYVLLDELLQADVLQESVHGYRFSHTALRDALLWTMHVDRRRELHLRCAEQRLQDAHDTQTTLARIEAGWHFMHAGEEGRGADLLAEVAYDRALAHVMARTKIRRSPRRRTAG
jgi:hypothetical protein